MINFVLFAFLLFGVCLARPSFPDMTDAAFQKECLDISNSARAQHHSPALRQDLNLIDYAKTRCKLISQYEKLSFGSTGLTQGFGENSFWAANGTFPRRGGEAVVAWYNEVNQYNFNTPGFRNITGHFTQLVWKGTVVVGCARCGGRGSQGYETYVICNYRPAGNINTAQAFRDNVLPK